MNISTKVAGLVTAGAVTAGVVAVATMASSPSANRTVSANSAYRTSRPPSAATPAGMMCKFDVVGMHRGKSVAVMSGHRRVGSLGSSAKNVPGTCLPANGRFMVQAANGKSGWVGAGHLSRQTVVAFLSTRYAVRNVRHGRRVAVLNRVGMKWRVVGTLRSNDRHVTGVALGLRKTTTVVVIIGHRIEAVVVPAQSVIVIADNGKLGTVSARFLTRVRAPMPTPMPTTTMPTMPASPTPSPSMATPAPTGTQAPIISNLNGRHSTKW